MLGQARLAQQQQALQTTVTDIASNMGTSKSISKPQPYDGKRSDDARRFMAAFELWSQGISSLRGRNEERIKSAISFLEGDAAIWATPISENISNVNNNVAGASFIYPTWNLFKEAFKARFETVNPVVDAKEALKGLWQGKNTVAAYAAAFKQHASRTGYSDPDLRDRFYQHLSNRVKDGLVYTDEDNIGTLDGLIQEAMHIDNRQIERAKERGQSITTPSRVPNSTSAFHAIPFAPAHDPNAMDVDATSTGRSPDDYRKFMAGRCYGCGSQNHCRADGHHERDICDYCGYTGHLANVCRRKFLGYPRPSQRTAATAGSSTSSIAATTAPTLPDFSQILQQLTANQKTLADQISELRQNF